MARKSPKKIQAESLKLDFLILIQAAIAVLFIARLFQIQVLNHEKYTAMAQEQYWSLQEIPAKRGNILSSDGYSLATTQVSYLLYAEPDKIDDPLQRAHDLAETFVKLRPSFYEDDDQKDALFESYKDRFYEVLSLDLRWVALEHYLGEKDRLAIIALGVEGFGFEEEPKRYYPEETLASHVLGFVAQNDGGEEQGYFGIEGNLNGDLKGKPGRVVEELDATGAPILVGGHEVVKPIDGREVFLTINRAVQYLVEKKLEKGVRDYGAAAGSVIVMDPYTGDVLAMANFPTYHPSRFNDITEEIAPENDSDELYYGIERRNKSISETYEPGSVMKALTVSTGIDSGKITTASTFEDNGPSHYSGYTIDNWDRKHHGTQTITELLQKSNNIGSAWVGHQVGSRVLHKYFSRFGVGEISGIDLEGEDTGIIRPYKDWTDIDLATAAFGQGISATPLQILNAFNAIANGGNLMRPRIVTKVVEGDDIIEIPARKVRSAISPESSAIMVDLLTQAVSGGESRYFNIKNYHVAGKTGTAQIPIDGEYDAEQTNATFVGFLPTSKKFSMIVRLDRPSSSVYASETAVPLWMSITDDFMKYYGLPPDSDL